MIKNKIEFEYFIKGKLAENGLNISKLAETLGTSQQNVSQRIKKLHLIISNFQKLPTC